MLMPLTGKLALVTGSAKGLGKMTALRLADEGSDIVINYVHSKSEAERLVETISSKGGRALAVRANVAVSDDIHRMVAEAEDYFGDTVDILVNNAGPFVRERRLFAEYEQEEIEALVHGNLLGVMILDHKVIHGMRRKQWGRIIHFGFGHAAEARGWPHRAAYAASKVGLVSFTKTLAVEEAEHGITVNMICPGDVRGEFKEKTIEQVRGLIDEESPRGRPGTGDDIARIIAFLCQERSDFITGNIIDVTGGMDPIRTLPLLR